MDNKPNMASRVLGNSSVSTCGGGVDVCRLPLVACIARRCSGMGDMVLPQAAEVAGESCSLQHRLACGHHLSLPKAP